MDCWLILEEGPINGGTYRLRQEILTIGRSPANPVQVVHTSVSRRHAQLKRGEYGYILTDLTSRNGTYINGQLLKEPKRLRNGDIIQIGDIMLLYLVGKGPEGQKDLVTSWKKASDTTRITPTTVIQAQDLTLPVPKRASGSKGVGRSDDNFRDND